MIISVVEADTRKEEVSGPSSSWLKKEPHSHAVKVFYGESTASEEEAKEKQGNAKGGIPKET